MEPNEEKQSLIRIYRTYNDQTKKVELCFDIKNPPIASFIIKILFGCVAAVSAMSGSETLAAVVRFIVH